MEGCSLRDECAIAAVGMAQATLAEIAHFRKNPGTSPFAVGDFSFLKHADEHTVVALAAILDALRQFPAGTSFDEWGVVAAPRWPGRLPAAAAYAKFSSDGPRGVSALLIPNICLHALSGSISLAFGMHGPNFGVGGGLANVADGLLAGLVVQLEQNLPGTWILLSEWDVEPHVPVQDQPTPVARALALAVVPANGQARQPRLRLQPAATSATVSAPVGSNATEHPRLAGLANFLATPSPNAAWSCTMDWGMELVVTAGEKA